MNPIKIYGMNPSTGTYSIFNGRLLTSISLPFLAFSTLPFATHRPGRQHGGVVVDVRDRDDGGGGVGEAEVQVALHVRGLHDDGVLGDFLRGDADTQRGIYSPVHSLIHSSAGRSDSREG